jgi:hypothetical protein
MSDTIPAWTRGLMAKWLENRRMAIWSTAVLAVLIRLAASMALKSYRFDPGDDHFAFGYEWGRIAKWLVERGMFSLDGSTPTADTDPLYIFIIAPFFQAFGTFSTPAAVGLIVFQSVLCGLGAWALFVLAEKLYGPVEARLSALMFACYPAAVFFAVGRIGPSILSILLICLIFLAVLDLPESPKPLRAVLAGFLMGVLTLTTGHLLSLLLVIPLWLVLIGRGRRLRLLLSSLIFVGTAMLVTLPWSIRNSLVLGQANISKGNLAYHLWAGNNPEATGYWRTSKMLPDGASRIDDVPQSVYLQMAASWVIDNPTDFLWLTLRRIKYFWHATPDAAQNSRGMYKLNTWAFIGMLSLSILGLFWSRGKLNKVSLLLIFFALYPLLFYITHFTHYRHRFNIEPFLLILASHGLYRLWMMLPRNELEARKLHGRLAGPERS